MNEVGRAAGPLLSRRDVLKRGGAAALLPTAAGVLAACGSSTTGGGATNGPVQGGTLQFGMPIEPLTLDMVTATWTDESALDLYERLVIQNSRGQYVGQLAESYKVSDDGETYTFKLRPDKTFHDGTAVNAQAVKEFFDLIRDPASKYTWATTYMSPIERIATRGDHTVTFHLKHPDSAFPFGISNTYAGIVSVAAREKAGEAFGTDIVVGSGPFKLKDWAAGDHVAVTRFDEYRNGGVNFRNQKAPYLDAIDYRYQQEAASRTLALQAGNIGAVRDLPYGDVERLRGSDKVHVASLPSWSIPIFMFNLDRPVFKDVRVRRAINQAIDKQAIVDTVTHGLGRPVNSPIVPHAPEYWPGSMDLYPYDPAAAKQLLSEAGWTPRGSSVVRDGRPLSIKLSVWNESRQQQQAQIIQNSLAQVGIKVAIEVSDKATLNGALQAGNFDIGTYEIAWTDPVTVTQLLFSSASVPFPNFARYKNPQLDKLFERIRVEAKNAAQRRDIAQQIQRTLLEDMPAVFLINSDQVYGVARNVHQLTPYVWSLWPYKLDTYRS